MTTTIKAVPMAGRYRVVVVEERSDHLGDFYFSRVVAHGPVIPEAMIHRVAAFLRQALPVLRTAAAARPAVSAIGDLFAAWKRATGTKKAARPRRARARS